MKRDLTAPEPESAELRVGLLGGSFDPVHSGHVAFAQAARRALELDRVLFLPTAHPPHKPERKFAPPLHRYVMVELALLAESGLFASPVEWTPGRAAYTVETVEHLAAERPGWKFVLLIGADSFGDLPQWRRWEDLVAQVEIAVAVRPGWDLESLRAAAPEALRAAVDGGRVHFLANAPVGLSSTELRAALARGENPPDGSLPPRVLDYACKYNLYR